MAGRWRDPTAFRADPAEAARATPTTRQAVSLVAVLVLVAGAIAAASFLIRPERARAFDLFSGSLFLDDAIAPVAVDLATGQPSVRLIDAATQVGASPTDPGALSVIPLGPGGGTLLLNKNTGEFNMADSTGFVIKHGAGVPLDHEARATGIPAGDPAAPDLAYIEQAGPDATAVYLVGQQTVREAADGAERPQPRAAISMPVPGKIVPNASAAADGHLWLLPGFPGSTRTITELSLPANSQSYGATLARANHGTVTGPAAIASATVGAGGASVIGVATSDRIEVFAPGADAVVARFSAPPGVRQILPASSGTGRLAFLMHGAQGWSVVSVGADGTGLRGPDRLANLTSSAQLVPPAASNGSLYTMDRGSGRILRIGPDQVAAGVAGADTYPLAQSNGKYIERPGFGDAYAIARGPRVFYDSPQHREALALFTDGSHPPLTIQKNAAVGLNAAGDAATLTRSRLIRSSHSKLPKAPAGQPKPHPKPPAPAPINNNVDCGTTTQKPHIPLITGAYPGSRSVSVSWTYPRIGRDDCVPQTYVVQVTLLSDNAPPAPASVKVSNQQSVDITGLFPSSNYEVSVTAVIRDQSTTSAADHFSTGAEGPAAPTDVRVHALPDGSWQLGWAACESVRNGCVPAQSWEVKASICDGHGLVGQLPSLLSPADPTTRRQPAAIYRGGTALLGRGLTFQVMGHGADGTAGALSARTPCVYSWSPPISSAMRLTASTSPQIAFGTTTTANVTLDLGAEPVRDVGGVGARVTLKLDGDGSSQVKGPFTVDGTQSAVSATFGGITPGAHYTATAVVQTAHGNATATLTTSQISTRADWPDFSVHPTCTQGLLSCSLNVTIGGLSSAAARGEHFDLTSNSQVVCGNTAAPLVQNDFDPAQTTITTDLSQKDGYYGQCTVELQLVEDAPSVSPLVFGGTTSPLQSASVQLGPPQTANVEQKDFLVGWSTQSGSSIEIRYRGSENLGALTGDWYESVTPPGAQDCADMSSSKQPGPDDTTATYIPIPGDCVNTHGSPANWTVTVQFRNTADSSTGGPFRYEVSGPPPGYQACAPSGLAAAWGATLADGIAVTVDGSAELGGCSAWRYTLTDTSTATQVCAGSTALVDGNSPPVTINTYDPADPTSCSTPPTDTWSLHIAWNDTAGNPQSIDVQLGAPPAT